MTPHRAAVVEWILTVAVIAVAMAVLMYVARAAPPEGADPAQAPYYHGLLDHNGISCCSIADCRPTEWRTVGDRYEAKSPEGWVVVPKESVLEPRPTPDGRATLCWTKWRGVMCFVPGAGT